MNIILISEEFSPNIGGAGIVVQSLANELKKGGHDILVIASKYPTTLKSTEVIDGIEVKRLKFIFPYRPYRQIFRFFILSPFVLLKLFLIIRSKSNSIINVHFATPRVLLPILILKSLTKFPLILNIHGEDVNSIPYQSFLNRWFLVKGLKRSDYIICNSQSTLEAVKKLIPVENLKIEIIKNGIRLEEFTNNEKFENPRPYIFALGRFVPVKRFDVLIHAFKAVINEKDDIDLVFAGDGSEKNNCEKLAKELGIENRVKFLGFTSREETVKLFNGCMFYVLPSLREAFGITLLEAMAAGKATIATKVGGIPEIMENNYNGLLVEPGNVHELANAILYLLDNREVSFHLGTNGRKLVEKGYRWEDIADRYMKIFQRF